MVRGRAVGGPCPSEVPVVSPRTVTRSLVTLQPCAGGREWGQHRGAPGDPLVARGAGSSNLGRRHTPTGGIPVGHGGAVVLNSVFGCSSKNPAGEAQRLSGKCPCP